MGFTERDEPKTWADLPAPSRSRWSTRELVKAREDMELAWRLYYMAIDREADMNVIQYQLGQAWVYEARFNDLYARINSNPEPPIERETNNETDN